MLVKVIDTDNGDKFVELTQEQFDRLKALQLSNGQSGYLAQHFTPELRDEVFADPLIDPTDTLPTLTWYW